MKKKPFRIQIPSSAPEIKSAEVFLPKGEGNYKDGWFVTILSEKAFEGEKLVLSSFPKPNFQIAATFDFRPKRKRIAFLVGKTQPISKLIVKIPDNVDSMKDDKVVVYWDNWLLKRAEWDGNALEVIKGTTPVRLDIKV